MPDEIKISIPQDESETALRTYRGIVSDLIEIGSGGLIPNKSPKHAAIIIEEMISHAKESFFAVADKFDASVWSDRVVAALGDAKRRGVRIGLLVVDGGSKALADWTDDIRSLVKSLSEQDKSPSQPTLNFAVMDKKAVRVEVDNTTFKAVFCANNSELAEAASSRFAHLEQRAVPLSAV